MPGKLIYINAFAPPSITFVLGFTDLILSKYFSTSAPANSTGKLSERFSAALLNRIAGFIGSLLLAEPSGNTNGNHVVLNPTPKVFSPTAKSIISLNLSMSI